MALLEVRARVSFVGLDKCEDFVSPSKCPDRIEWFRGGGVELKMFYFKTTLAPRLKSSFKDPQLSKALSEQQLERSRTAGLIRTSAVNHDLVLARDSRSLGVDTFQGDPKGIRNRKWVGQKIQWMAYVDNGQWRLAVNSRQAHGEYVLQSLLCLRVPLIGC